MRRSGIAVISFLAAAVLPVAAARAPDRPKERKPAPDAATAVRRSLALIQHGAASYVATQDCFSCHHQALPLMTLGLAGRAGMAVDAAGVRRQVEFTTGYFSPLVAEIRRGLGVQGANDTVGYALAGLAAARKSPDETTEAMASFLMQRQLPDGSWMPAAERPPFEGSAFTSTAIALAGLRDYWPRERATEMARARNRASAWLRQSRPKDLEDRVYQLRSLALVGDHAGAAAAVSALRAAQRPDGSWSQLARLPGDAYATGAALLALAEAGNVPPADPAYLRGVGFLLNTQREDGSWFVATRSKPVQEFFDNGDPHGKSQFISYTATNLAAMALLRGLPAAADSQKP